MTLHDSKAMIRTILGGLIVFLLGFIGGAIGLAWFLMSLRPPGTSWWSLLSISPHLLLWAFVFGLALAGAAVWCANTWYYWRGVYRCPFCERPLGGINKPCDCREATAIRES